MYKFSDDDNWCGEDEYNETVRCLMETGKCDPSDKDALSRDVYTLFNGPSGTFSWLRKQGQTPLLDFCHSTDESMRILMGRARRIWPDTIRILRDMLPEGSLDCQIARYKNEMGETLLFVLARCWAVLNATQQTNKCNALGEWEAMIGELIRLGADLHALYKTAYGEHRTPLQAIMLILATRRSSCSASNSHPRRFRLIIRQWLELLSNARVDLEAYGLCEADLLASGKVSWTFPHSYEKCNFACGDMQIIDLSFGKNPRDFQIVWEDLYVSGGILMDFWHEVEVGHNDTPSMPGSWLD